jgi:hypothetical protein
MLKGCPLKSVISHPPLQPTSSQQPHPKDEASLPEPVKTACRQVAEIKDCGTGPSEGKTSGDKSPEVLEIEIALFPDIVRETRREKAPIENSHLGDRDSVSIKKRSFYHTLGL